MPSSKNESDKTTKNNNNAVASTTNEGSLALLDAKSKQKRKPKSGDDVSFQSESAESKSSRSVRRVGRKRTTSTTSTEISVSSSGDASRQAESDNIEKEASDKPSRLSDVMEKQPTQSRRNSAGTSQSGSSNNESKDAPNSRRIRSSPASEKPIKKIQSPRREGNRRSRSEDESHNMSGSVDDNPPQKSDESNTSIEDQFGSFPISELPHHADEFTALEDAFGSFPIENGNQGRSFVSDFSALSPFNTKTTEFPSMNTFDSAFAARESSFQSFEQSFSVLSTTEFEAFDSFDKSLSFPKQSAIQETVWETSPLSQVPKIKKGEYNISRKKLFSQDFVCAPVSNPLNGNVICCVETNGVFYIQENDTNKNNLQVSCKPILTEELRHKISIKFNSTIHSVSQVVTLQCGLHFAEGRTRLRVGLIVEFKIMETSQSLKLLLLWRWGYGLPLIGLQYALSLPTGNDYSFDTDNLTFADNIIFLAGASQKGSVVFICKPVVSDSWSANNVATDAKICKLSLTDCTKRGDFPYLTIALSDNSLSVWTYKAALSTTAFKDKATKRILFPLCRLDYLSIESAIKSTETDEGENPDSSDEVFFGECTEIAWIPSSSPLSSMMLLAAAFQHGIAVFHVALPVMLDNATYRVAPMPDPSESTTLSSTPKISPIAAKRWQRLYKHSSLSWVDLGSLVGPALAVLLFGQKGVDASILVCSIDFPSFRRGPAVKRPLLPLSVLAKLGITKHLHQKRAGLLRSATHNAALFYNHGDVVRVSLSSLRSFDLRSAIQSLKFPICSQSSGLTTFGDSLDEENGILYIYKTIQCERRKVDLAKVSTMEWTLPVQRYWICRVFARNDKSGQSENNKKGNGFRDSPEREGGETTELMCEIYHDALFGLLPFRIMRCGNSSMNAVLFRSPLASQAKNTKFDALQAVKVALVNSKKRECEEILEGRDLTFFPISEDGRHSGLILNMNGSSLGFFSWDEENKLQLSTKCRPILGVDSDKDYIDCHRVFLISKGSKVAVACSGRRIRDNKVCFTIGKYCEMSTVTAEGWAQILPNIVKGPTFWLEDNEIVLSVVALPSIESSDDPTFAIGSSARVFLLSPELILRSEVRTNLSSPTLIPVGSFLVCYEADAKLQYLTCLSKPFCQGLVASFSEPISKPSSVVTLRPDQTILLGSQSSVRLVDAGENSSTFFLPAAFVKPILLLEPLVANAVSILRKQNRSSILRTIVEKFGRKVSLITHSENEGIGQKGAGVTSRVFSLLEHHGEKHASNWLLRGTVQTDLSAGGVVLPHWLPITAKSHGTYSDSSLLHVLTNGDSDLAEYVRLPDENLPSALPRFGDPTSYLSDEFADVALSRGDSLNTLPMLDLCGAETAYTKMLLVALTSRSVKSQETSSLLGFMGGKNIKSGQRKGPSSLTALAVLRTLQERSRDKEPNAIKGIGNIAPSLQKCPSYTRGNPRLMGKSIVAESNNMEIDRLWRIPCNESRHVWNEGPMKNKSRLLVLGRLEDWLERKRPAVLGKEGVSSRRDRGENALAEILFKDDDSFGEKSDIESVKDSWVEGVGEGRSDEANLSGYFRFSEGADEDHPWRSEGLADLSPYQNKALVVGDSEMFSLQSSTSNVDEGDPGKVKGLYDLVCERQGVGLHSGISLVAQRGGSLDIGVLHTMSRDARKKCSIEFWFYLPVQQAMGSEMILVRRTMGKFADDVCLASNKESMLWELSLQSTGDLIFRTCAKSKVLSKNKKKPPDTANDRESINNDVGRISFERWNHVCITLSSKGLEMMECSIKILVKGATVASSTVSMLPPGVTLNDPERESLVDDALQKSHIVFGLNHPAGFRLTELRIWACARSEDDVKSFLYEYLTAAEQKKKFTVKITNKNKKGGPLPKLGMKGVDNNQNADGSSRHARLIPMKSGGLVSLTHKHSSPEKKSESGTSPHHQALAPISEPAVLAIADPPTPGSFGTSESQNIPWSDSEFSLGLKPSNDDENDFVEDEEVGPITLWDTAVALSLQIRASAAAALIRGPPATRHYGGNRGGLPDFSGVDRFGVGGIAVCGSEKTIVFRDNEDPPALTYPIGASGAIISDQMDDEGSEFLCCFLAKEKRMVVFELRSRTVVVELQMTTKLNFWRYLPPEAAGNTLCFMLISPVGGFHWLPLEESPRPHQVWKRGPDLQGKKIVSYEEGGSNGLDDDGIKSKLGLILATKASGGGSLEAWIVPICGNSAARCVSYNVLGACLCQPSIVDDGPFLPHVVLVNQRDDAIVVNIVSIIEQENGSLEIGNIEATQEIDISEYEEHYEPPPLAMGTYPEALCVSLSNIIVVILRRKGVIAAFELEDDVNLIAQECVDHFIIDAVMRYSAEVGGAEIVMLLADNENSKDGRIVSFCFRSAA